MRRANIFTSLILMAFTGFYAVLISRLPDRNLPHTLGAAFVPWVMAGFLLLLALLLLVSNLKTKSDQGTVDLPLKELAGIAGLVVLIFLYIEAMDLIGFVMASFLFMAALIYIAGSRKLFEIVFFSIATTLTIYFLFQKFFNVQLPAGSLF